MKTIQLFTLGHNATKVLMLFISITVSSTGKNPTRNGLFDIWTGTRPTPENSSRTTVVVVMRSHRPKKRFLSATDGTRDGNNRHSVSLSHMKTQDANHFLEPSS